MNISFSKKEYRLLVDMLHIADWMLTAHLVEPQKTHHEYMALKDRICSHAKEMGMEHLVEYIDEVDGYYETRPYDTYLHETFIEPYDEETFWEELTSRLAERDLIEKIGLEGYRSMEGMKRVRELGEISDQYDREFEQHGLEHVRVDCGKSDETSGLSDAPEMARTKK